MLESLLNFDTYLFRLINHARCPFLDSVLAVFSWHFSIGVIVGLITLYVMWQKKWEKWWLYLAVVGLCFLLADRISVMCFKDVFQRLRPSHALQDAITLKISHLHYITTNKGGLYGFVSSHAANTFSIITSMSLIMRKEKNLKIFSSILIAWGIIVGYSRVYCGYHYPGDVVCGALLGIVIGLIVYLIYKKIISLGESKTKQTNE